MTARNAAAQTARYRARIVEHRVDVSESPGPDSRRRRAVAALGVAALAPFASLLPRAARAQGAPPASVALRAAPARVAMLGDGQPVTSVWAYNGQVPGPVLRVAQGDVLRVRATNDLAEPTTIHWHGLRIPNAMDGVPGVTQRPIAAAGGTFDYAFACPDAGTFWYHPHLRGHVQVAMGLHGVLIVDEPEKPAVDRDVLWVLDDWRLTREGQVSAADFGAMFDASHAGRIGNTVTINGTLPDRVALAAGERLRLRLVNVANARVFALRFDGHAPWVVAHDGMPCAPYQPRRGRVVLGPGMRADLVLEAIGEPGAAFRVTDDFYPGQAYEVVTLAYGPDRLRTLGAPLTADLVRLPPNPVPEPDVANAERHVVTFTGGMMGGMGGGGMGGGMMGGGAVWAVNGVAMTDETHAHAPLLTLAQGRTHVIELRNQTAWFHPIHVHGHSFRILSRNGRPLPRRDLADTTLLAPRETAEIAFVADNPGDWMFHCHVLEHQATGMMATLRVA